MKKVLLITMLALSGGTAMLFTTTEAKIRCMCKDICDIKVDSEGECYNACLRFGGYTGQWTAEEADTRLCE